MVIVACGIYKDELKEALPEGADARVVWLDPALHADLDLLKGELEASLEGLAGERRKVVLLFGRGCHPDIQRLAEGFGARLAGAANCIEALAGERKQELEEGRTMLMTPGWVRAWPDIMARLGWNETDARINLGRYDRILILEPGLNPLADEEILAFFDLVQVPAEMEPLDLTHFKNLLARLLDRP